MYRMALREVVLLVKVEASLPKVMVSIAGVNVIAQFNLTYCLDDDWGASKNFSSNYKRGI